MEHKIILLADDDADDREMFCEALEKISNTLLCHTTSNGQQLLDTLHQLETAPSLIFLDLNMPIMNGHEALQTIKQNKAFSPVPVIMISTSSHRDEINRSLDLGAHCYLVKPHDYNLFKAILKDIVNAAMTDLETSLLDGSFNKSGYVFTRFNTFR